MKDDYDGHLFFQGLINGLAFVLVVYGFLYFLYEYQDIVRF